MSTADSFLSDLTYVFSEGISVRLNIFFLTCSMLVFVVSFFSVLI